MTAHTQLVLGGARSGKSRYAEQCAMDMAASQSDSALVYIATATSGDAEMAQRIALHRQRRDARWQLIEQAIDLGGTLSKMPSNAVVLIDCLTLWLSNCLHEGCWEEQRRAFTTSLSTSDASVIMVSNEVGNGVVPMGELSRNFVDQSGWLHQELASMCTQVTLIVAGLPMSLKGQLPDLTGDQ